MIKKSLLVLCCIFVFSSLSNAQTTPVPLDTNISISKVIDVSMNLAVKIDIDPISGDLIYSTLNGNIYKIIMPLGLPAYDSLIYTSSDHGITNTQGICFYDSTFYLTGNTPLDAFKKRSAIVVRGKLQSNGTRVWSVVAESERFPAAALFDHLITSIIAMPDGDSLLFSSGSRGDHGEIQDNNGSFPGKRLCPISSKILKIPANGNNFFIPNNTISLNNLNLVYAEGVRNNFDMAYNAAGELFGTENAGDRDMDEELNWLRDGHHYGFPWYMGNELNPSQFPSYNPNIDLLINHAAYAWVNGLFTNDPTFPAPPVGVTFTEPCANEGPDADILRDSITGNLIDATALGSSKYTYSFTAHRSPLGLTFDNDSLLDGQYRGGAFVCSYTRGDSTLSNYSELMAPMGDASEDLLFIDMRRNTANDNYIFSATKIIEKLNSPADAVLIGNRMYILETGNIPGPSVWEVIFPPYNAACSINSNITTNDPTTFCGPTGALLEAAYNPNYTYQWHRNNNALAGATSNTYLTKQGGPNWLVITDTSSGCIDTSNIITTTRLAGPSAAIINTSPLEICGADGTLLFAQTIPGSSYQWLRYGNPAPGNNNDSTYALTKRGNYKVRLTAANGCSKTSARVVVIKNWVPKSAVDQLGPISACIGQTVTLRAAPTFGTPPFVSYQWYKYSSVINGQTADSIVVSANGGYSVRVIDSKGCANKSPRTVVNFSSCPRFSSSYLNSELQVQAFPVPFDEMIQLHISTSSDEKLSVKIADALGRKVYEKEGDATKDWIINTSTFNSGLYFIEVLQGQNASRVKVVKE